MSINYNVMSNHKRDMLSKDRKNNRLDLCQKLRINYNAQSAAKLPIIEYSEECSTTIESYTLYQR